MTQYIIELGSVVRLHSGGPEMTVYDIQIDEEDENQGVVSCVWFQQEGTHCDGTSLFAGHPLKAKFRSENLTLILDEEE